MVVYAVFRYGGDFEDYYEKLDKCFTNLKAAEEYVAMLEEAEEALRCMRDKCANCSGSDRTCPLWQDSYEDSDECYAWYNTYHENEYYKIEDIELIGES